MNFISRLHESIRNARTTRRGAMRPLYTPEPYKEYPRMPQIPLPSAQTLRMPLSDALFQRHSLEHSQSGGYFTERDLGTLLGNAFGVRTSGKSRNYPSGGGLFPIETYLIGKILEGHPRGMFHYHPPRHALEYLWDMPETLEIDDVFKTPSTPHTDAAIVFTAVWDRSRVKYGDFAYYLAMLEAGHMAQNILLVATAMKCSARPIGGYEDDAISLLLDLEKSVEDPVYTIALSPPDARDASLGAHV